MTSISSNLALPPGVVSLSASHNTANTGGPGNLGSPQVQNADSVGTGNSLSSLISDFITASTSPSLVAAAGSSLNLFA
jgi:hypothetical protein